MLKVTILLAIFAIVSFVVFKCLVKSMTRWEMTMLAIGDDAPTRCVIAFWVTALLSVATIVCLIITIVAW